MAAVLLLISAVTALFFLFYHNSTDYTSTFFSLDTIISVRMSEDLIDETKSKITKLNDLYDIYSESSEIHKLNSSSQLKCSDEVTDIMNKTLALNQKYGSKVDISAGKLNLLWKEVSESGVIPDKSDISEALINISYKNISVCDNRITLHNDISVDLGAVAKGYALDLLYPLYKEKALESAIISMGSSTLLYSNESNHIFTVAIKDSSDSVAGTVSTTSCFVSTSGDYERYAEVDGIRYHHIIDLETGYPAGSGLSSVTVFSSSGLESDFLSTYIFIDGKKNLSKHLSADNYKIVAIDTEGQIFKSESLNFTENN